MDNKGMYIKTKQVEDMLDVAYLMDEAFKKIDKENLETITFIGNYEETMNLLHMLLECMDSYIPHSLEIASPEINGYDDAYILTITYDELIFVEPMKRNNQEEYIGFSSEVVFIVNDNSNINIYEALDKNSCDIEPQVYLLTYID